MFKCFCPESTCPKTAWSGGWSWNRLKEASKPSRCGSEFCECFRPRIHWDDSRRLGSANLDESTASCTAEEMTSNMEGLIHQSILHNLLYMVTEPVKSQKGSGG